MTNYAQSDIEASWPDRHPSTKSILKFIAPSESVRNQQGFIPDMVMDIYETATNVMEVIEKDSPELTAGLRKLLEAKDCFVRAALDEQPGFWTDR